MQSSEKDNISFKPITISAFVLLGVVILTFIGTWIFIKWDGRDYDLVVSKLAPNQSELPKQFENFPNPRLQMRPQTDLKVYLKQQKEHMGSYGWVDKTKGVVHIPIDKAIEYSVKGATE
jgi:hypothetical protein